jgi:hypothetical protein
MIYIYEAITQTIDLWSIDIDTVAELEILLSPGKILV